MIIIPLLISLAIELYTPNREAIQQQQKFISHRIHTGAGGLGLGQPVGCHNPFGNFFHVSNLFV